MYRILTIAGSDSCGGAGIQADLKTISALGCYGMSAITAITAQNISEITEVLALSPSLVIGQMRAVIGGVNAIKLGMLANDEIVDALCGELKKHTAIPLVLDPVLQATSGAVLFEGNPNCFQKLFPFADLITPNIPEAMKLTGISISSKQEMESAGQALLDLGAKAVLIKGGHLNGATDCLIVKGDKPCWIEGNYIQTKNTHGTGCRLSSAIACYLAQGWSLKESVQLAKQYLEEELQR